jgi:pimeloyl-ACP methyl ester carboxylesterase
MENRSEMKRPVLAWCLLTLASSAVGGSAACSSKKSDSQTDAGGGDDAGTDGPVGNFQLEVGCTDSIDAVYADPGDVTGAPKGAILRCAHDQDFTASQLLAASQAGLDAGEPPYAGRPFTSGAHVYRILYRTERGDLQSTPGYSSALVLLPDTPRATPAPVIVASHGSRGQAAACAPSKADPAAADVEPDFLHLVYPLVGSGFPVIAPDLAGYANFGAPNNPPSAYDSVQDVGKSTLDGARALRTLVPSSVAQQVVLVGHSQGGHTTFSALSLADSYGAGGVIAAAAVYSPLWLTQRLWGAVLLEPQSFGFAQSSVGFVSIWYHYTHGELLDGPGHGLDLFQPSKQAAVKSFVDNDCFSETYPDMMDAGTSANDFFTTSYAQAIALAATPLGSGNCKGDATCQKWLDRMTADWPHLTGGAAKVPILVYYANDDTTITPDAMQCVLDRLTSDAVDYTFCYDPNPVGHAGVVSYDSNYVADWIAQQTLGAPPPTEPCQTLAPNDAGIPQLVDDAGQAIGCNSLLPMQ